MRFLSNFGCKIIFMCSVNFWHQQYSNSLFKRTIDHVTSWCKWPIKLFVLFNQFFLFHSFNCKQRKLKFMPSFSKATVH